MVGKAADRDQIRASVQRRGIRALYHFTRIRHLASIIETGGLLSLSGRRERNVTVRGNTWGYHGKDEEFADYVCCSFLPNWGMMAKADEALCIVEISSDLIWRDGTLFCPDNSANNKFTLAGLQSASTANDFDAMFPNPDTWKTRALQAEILVYRFVPLTDFQAFALPDL